MMLGFSTASLAVSALGRAERSWLLRPLGHGGLALQVRLRHIDEWHNAPVTYCRCEVLRSAPKVTVAWDAVVLAGPPSAMAPS